MTKRELRTLLSLWAWECRVQGWMLDNQNAEDLLAATDRAMTPDDHNDPPTWLVVIGILAVAIFVLAIAFVFLGG